jgi:hypothetical protein
MFVPTLRHRAATKKTTTMKWPVLAVALFTVATARAGVVGPAPAANAPAAADAAEWNTWDMAHPLEWSVNRSGIPGAAGDPAAPVEPLQLPELSADETAAAAAQVELEATGAWGGLPAPAPHRRPIAFQTTDEPRPPAIPLPPAAWTGLSALAGIGLLAANRRVRRWLC